jgi:hypothetical protein
VTPVLSVAAFQVSWTDVGLGVVAASPLGAPGAVVSTVHVAVAALLSLVPLTVALTENVCWPCASPV